MRQGTNAGDIINKRNCRTIFADYVRQREAAQLGLRAPLRIQAFNGGTNPALAFQLAVEGAAYTSIDEYNSYISRTVNPAPAATVPNPPTGLVATGGNAEASIAFSIPTNDGGSPIISYTITSNPDNITVVGTTSPLTITGLTNGTSYTFTAVATNTIGNSVASDPSTAVIPSTIPSAPTGLSVTPGNGQLEIAFTAGSDGGSPITNYKYSINSGVTFTDFSPSQTSSPVTITGLTNGTTYSVVLRAVNINGTSLSSLAVPGTPANVPSAPTALSGVGGNEAIYILFTAGSNNGNEITNYQYSINDGAFTDFSPAQTISPVLISGVGLVNGTSYSIKLKAVNAIGTSVESASVSVTPTVTSLLATSRLINLDSTNSSSYSGSGTTWTNLDSAGAYSATLNGSPTYNTSDPSNKYFEFNPGAATGQFAQINQAAAINPIINTPFTIQMWVRITNAGSGGGALVSKVFGSPSFDGYALYYQANNSIVLHENGSTQVNFFTSPTNVLSNGWALYTANIQFGNGGGRTNKIFVNGRQVVSQVSNESGIPSNNQNLTFPTGFGGEGECDIGAFYYYNAELTTTQIIQNFDATKSRYSVSI